MEVHHFAQHLAKTGAVWLPDAENFKVYSFSLTEAAQRSSPSRGLTEEYFAAAKLQAVYKGYRVRELVWGRDGLQEQAAVIRIQHWRMNVLTKRRFQEEILRRRHHAAKKIQAQAKARAKQRRTLLAVVERELRNFETLFQQSVVQVNMSELSKSKRSASATLVQKVFRKHKARATYLKLRTDMKEAKQSLQVSPTTIQAMLESFKVQSDQSLRDSPELENQFVKLGLLLHAALNNPVEALNVYSRILRCNPQSPWALYLTAVAGIDANMDPEESYVALQEATKIKSAGFALVGKFYWLFKARIGRFDEYRAAKQLAIAVAVITNDRERAEILFDKAMRLAPDAREITHVWSRCREFWLADEQLICHKIKAQMGHLRVKRKGDSYIFGLLDKQAKHEAQNALPTIIALSEFACVLQDSLFDVASCKVSCSHVEIIAQRIRKVRMDHHKIKLFVPTLSKFRETRKLKMRCEKLLVSAQKGFRGLMARREVAREKARMKAIATQRELVLAQRAAKKILRHRKLTSATIIQRRARGTLERSKLERRQSAAVTMQKHLRAFFARQMVSLLREEHYLGDDVKRVFLGAQKMEIRHLLLECLHAGSTFCVNGFDTNENEKYTGFITKGQMHCKDITSNLESVQRQLPRILDDLVLREVSTCCGSFIPMPYTISEFVSCMCQETQGAKPCT